MKFQLISTKSISANDVMTLLKIFETHLFLPKFLTQGAKVGFFPPRAQRKAPVAQLDRASDYESEGQGFESLRVYHSQKPCNSKGYRGFFR